MRKVPCFCDNIVEFDFPETINLKENPEYYGQISDGTFQSVTCDSCGSLLKPELSVRITDPDRNIDLYYISETDRVDFMGGKIRCPAPKLVIGYSELAEKIRLAMESVNDGAVEVIKYYLKKKAGSDDITIFFDHREKDNLVFHIFGMRKDEIAVSRIPMSVYDTTVKSMENIDESELYSLILTPPYISSNKISVTEDE